MKINLVVNIKILRQDRQVEILMRKLAKAEAHIKKLATKNLDEIDECFIPPDSPVRTSSRGKLRIVYIFSSVLQTTCTCIPNHL